jgi:hypothetical protein
MNRESTQLASFALLGQTPDGCLFANLSMATSDQTWHCSYLTIPTLGRNREQGILE